MRRRREAMSDAYHLDGIRVPKPILIAAGALMLFTIVVAGMARLDGTGAADTAITGGHAVATRALLFDDRADGSVLVRDATTGAQIAILPVATNGFIRASLRGLATERRREGEGRGKPFLLTKWSDGRLTLDDEADGRHVELEAFGQNQIDAFARFLPTPPRTAQAEATK